MQVSSVCLRSLENYYQSAKNYINAVEKKDVGLEILQENMKKCKNDLKKSLTELKNRLSAISNNKLSNDNLVSAEDPNKYSTASGISLIDHINKYKTELIESASNKLNTNEKRFFNKGGTSRIIFCNEFPNTELSFFEFLALSNQNPSKEALNNFSGVVSKTSMSRFLECKEGDLLFYQKEDAIASVERSYAVNKRLIKNELKFAQDETKEKLQKYLKSMKDLMNKFLESLIQK